MKNIVLTGFMATGKTTVGCLLSDTLDRPLIDIDSEIETATKMKINEIFATHGEPHFRQLETEMAIKVSSLKGVIISTGGGIVLRQENMTYLRSNGYIVCLMATPEAILSRVAGTDDRPLLKVPNPLQKIYELLNFRRPLYEKADLVIDTDDKTPEMVVAEVIAMTTFSL
ncbi:shikimate kinase [Candidatus Magnetobacterium bavaricum]|uniref:Shikimate kinase n=1 Tax=Candidatus Magnetobacterium bavaricum TaxID=29290 RepID=A0A0F3GWH5_9BACT|nr:shikimate kinase [Candidatus Magnetobacterium bavaricum]